MLKITFDKKNQKVRHDILQLRKQKQPSDMFCKKGVLKNFLNLIGKHLCQSLLFNKVTCLRLQLF